MSGQTSPDSANESTDIDDTAPLAVQAVLKKIGGTELARAKRCIVEEVRLILARVNTALCGLHMANAVFEEEAGKIDEKDERERRNERLADIKNFLLSIIKKKNNLTTVFECLENITDDFAALEADTNFIEVDNITQEWVARKEANVFEAMSNIESGVLRLRQLCGIFFSMQAEATKKDHAKKKVNDVRCWWKQTRMDAHMFMKIQEMQPPSTESMLNDSLLDHKAVTDLSVMLEDMAKAFAQSKAMKIAFQFAQTGISNLSRALKERSREVQALRNKVDKLQAHETLAEVERLLNKLSVEKAHTAQLMQENNTLKGNNEQLLKQIEKLQSQLFDEKPIMYTEDIATPPATPKRRQPKQEQVQIQQKTETRIIYVEKERHEKQAEPIIIPVVSKEESEDEQEQEQEEASVFVEAEKESKNLLSTFQVYVSDIVKKALKKNMPDDLKKMEVDAHRTNDVIQLYHTLQHSLHSTFEDIMSNMNISSTSGILGLPVKDEHLQPFQFVDNKATPGQMLQDISNSMKRSDEEFATVSESVQGLQENLRDQARDVCQQLQNIHERGKEQSSKMRLVLENLVEVYKDTHPQPEEDTKNKPLSQKQHSPSLPPVAQKPKLRQLSPKEKLPPKIPTKVQKTPVIKTNTAQSSEVTQIAAKPGQMLQDISKSVKRSDGDFASVSESVQGLQENLRDQAIDVCQQLQNIHDRGKEQSPTMRLALENLAEKPKLRQLSSKEKLPPKILTKVRKTPIMMKANTPQPFETPQIAAKPFRELLERYEKDLLSEEERILRDEGRGGKYQLRMKSHLTNLRVLHQALVKEDISAELYCLAKDLIKHCMNVNEMRLGSLMRKYIAHQTLLQVRSNINGRVFSAREHNDGPALRDLYIFLDKTECYKSSVMKRWKEKQMTIEDERKICLAKILHLFRQFELDLHVTLVKPHICADKYQVQRFPTVKSQLSLNVGCCHHGQSRATPLSFFIKTEPGIPPQPRIREICKPRVSATWNFDVTMDNMQLASKKPVMVGAPPFPRLCEMDIAQSRQKALRIAQARIIAPMMSRGDL